MDQKNQVEALRNPVVEISTAREFREAITRLRFLEGAAEKSSLGRERAALELAVAAYLIARPR